MRRRGFQEEYKDVYLRNLNLLNNQIIANTGFETIFLANKLRHIRINPTNALFQENTNKYGPSLEDKLGYLYFLSRAETTRQRLDEAEKKTIKDIEAILLKQFGTYDVLDLINLSFSYYDILVQYKLIGITHGREEETLKAKLDKW